MGSSEISSDVTGDIGGWRRRASRDEALRGRSVLMDARLWKSSVCLSNFTLRSVQSGLLVVAQTFGDRYLPTHPTTCAAQLMQSRGTLETQGIWGAQAVSIISSGDHGCSSRAVIVFINCSGHSFTMHEETATYECHALYSLDVTFDGDISFPTTSIVRGSVTHIWQLCTYQLSEGCWWHHSCCVAQQRVRVKSEGDHT